MSGGFAKTIIEHVPKAALYELLAEECTELAQACLKRSRQLRDDNPTPVSEEEALKMCSEEAGDVELCLHLLSSDFKPDAADGKLLRWVNRLRERGMIV